ncbi:cysteine hydrolase family protein [Marinobacter pelagius]|uniref:Nicotinamidase-related amidase n=1 Tax=Marinobacter pelagius TaxID=379482 RepID=A0A1I4RJ40_9GAMM|nr:cysteine hydrolase family protein [Marinobacter pelagius]SFM51963.1 Nicotinamidase-related amidase [Marinobacter pelagius]
MSNPQTLRDLVGLGNSASPISSSALVIIDAQQTYREGVMQLEGVEPALEECRKLLDRFRAAGRPVFHIQHDAGAGSPYDINAPIGQIADIVAPKEGEPVVTKNYPNSFASTDLDKQLKEAGIENLILVGFMSHMCVNATAREAFSLGYNPTVVASATATRALPSPISGEVIPADQVHMAAHTAIADLPSAVVASVADVPD